MHGGGGAIRQPPRALKSSCSIEAGDSCRVSTTCCPCRRSHCSSARAEAHDQVRSGGGGASRTTSKTCATVRTATIRTTREEDHAEGCTEGADQFARAVGARTSGDRAPVKAGGSARGPARQAGHVPGQERAAAHAEGHHAHR